MSLDAVRKSSSSMKSLFLILHTALSPSALFIYLETMFTEPLELKNNISFFIRIKSQNNIG